MAQNDPIQMTFTNLKFETNSLIELPSDTRTFLAQQFYLMDAAIIGAAILIFLSRR